MKEYTRTISRALSFLLAGCILRSSLCMPVSANLNTTIQEEAAPQKVEKQSAESDFEQPYFSGGKSMNAVVVESMNNLPYPASPQTGANSTPGIRAAILSLGAIGPESTDSLA